MGAEVFGAFSGVLAVVIIAMPFFAFGAGSVLIKDCSINRDELSEYIGNSLLMGLITCSIALPALYFIQNKFFTAELGGLIFLTVFLSDFVFSKLNELAAQVFQSQGEIFKVAEFTIFTGVVRVLVVGFIYFYHVAASLEVWLLGYFVSALAGAVYAWVCCIRKYGLPKASFKSDKIGEGLYFSAGLASQGVYNDADKAIILRYDTPGVSGNYSAAYKIVDIAFAPTRALLSVTYVGFFKAGSSGIYAAYAYALKVLPLTIVLGFIGMVGILAASFLVEPVLGDSFKDVRHVLNFICVIPLLRSVHFVLADCLTGAGLQRTRSYIQGSIALVNIIANIVLIPMYSWHGAAFASVFCDLLLCFILYFALRFLIKNNIRADSL